MDKFDALKAIIVDDSPQARKLLRLMLQELCPEVVVCAEAENVPQTVEAIKREQPHVVFLDIEMPGQSGLQLVEELSQQEVPYEIIFTTAYNQYALDAFRLSAIDYLLKPINEKHLLEAIEKLKQKQNLQQVQLKLQALSQNLKQKDDKVLCIPVQSGYEYIPVKAIEYIEADGSYTQIHLTDDKRKTVSKNLKHFEQILEHAQHFVRVHRSYIINLERMVAFSKTGGGTITMANGRHIDLARDRRSMFLKIIGQ
jgi:two-component system LytT family response regulator